MRRPIRWGIAVEVVVLALAVAVLSTACGSGSSTTSTTTVTDASVVVAPTTTGPTTTSTTPPARPMAVAATVTVELVDRTRSTTRNGAAIASERRLPTTVWRPTAPGPWPLVVFAHGYRLGPDGYARFCASLAAQGYVVAAPSFPLADESRGNGVTRDDIPAEAVDVAFVDRAIRTSSVGESIAAGPYAAVGHSDGADVVLLVGFGGGRVDREAGAIVAMSPDAMTGTIVRSPVPLLITHGTADSVVPYSEAVRVDAQIVTPHWFLTLDGADHLPPVAERTKWTTVLDAAVVAFLDVTIGSRADQLDGLAARLDALDLSTVKITD